MVIRILITGGTIDDRHLSSRKSKRPMTYLPRMLKEARVTVPIVLERICQKDSRAIDESDRKKILLACKNSKENSIVITHGTYAMQETASYLGLNIKNKTVVLTGSAVPFAEKKSDAMFNLGAALAAVQTLEKGVYVVMNGRVFNWDDVRKDFKSGKFVSRKK